MKKVILFIVVVLVFTGARIYAQGTATVVLTAGQLLTSSSIAIPDGALVQLIGDTTSTAGAPTATSFTGSDPNEQILDSFAVNSSSSGTPGVFQDSITINLGTGLNEIPTGDYLFLRWYPTIQYSTYLPGSSEPGSGTTYGQFTSSTEEFPGDPDPTIAWVAPSSGAEDDLWFLTVSEASTFGPSTPNNPPANSAGVANLTVAAVPEPGSVALLMGAFGVGAMAFRRRRK
ncbi:MAG TPA: PEP-CTERM sorting domain-containing protein [Chthoniobacteraceae bacterium]|jgi:hypothetical protein|nr:PEP-CTERM sorting domain-containing protein [Chthoniobacteraceae bacterium]